MLSNLFNTLNALVSSYAGILHYLHVAPALVAFATTYAPHKEDKKLTHSPFVPSVAYKKRAFPPFSRSRVLVVRKPSYVIFDRCFYLDTPLLVIPLCNISCTLSMELCRHHFLPNMRLGLLAHLATTRFLSVL